MNSSDSTRIPQQKWILTGTLPSGDLFNCELSGERLTVGRSTSNSIQLNDPTVSGTHANIEKIDGCWVLRDLNSSNGTFVNGKAIDQIELSCPLNIVFGSLACKLDATDAAEDSTNDASVIAKEHEILLEEHAQLKEQLIKDSRAFAERTNALTKAHGTAIADKQNECDQWAGSLAKSKEVIEAAETKYQDTIIALERAEESIRSLSSEHASEIQQLQATFHSELSKIEAQSARLISDYATLREAKEKAIAAITAETQARLMETRQDYERQIDELKEVHEKSLRERDRAGVALGDRFEQLKMVYQAQEKRAGRGSRRMRTVRLVLIIAVTFAAGAYISKELSKPLIPPHIRDATFQGDVKAKTVAGNRQRNN